MTDSSNRFKIKNTDFGFSQISRPASLGKQEHNGGSAPKSVSLSNFKPSLTSLKSSLMIFGKKTIKIFNRMKWKVSRSIFLGRGIYFKYISNLSILIIVIFGTFVYLEFQTSAGRTPLLASKYAKGASEPESVLIASAGKSTLPVQPLSVIKYKVNSGDTLSSIAKQFSNEETQITVDSIKWANNLQADSLQPGTVLDIPPVSGTLHTVAKGEDIYTIAKKYGKLTSTSNEIEQFAAIQQITNDNVLDVKVEGEKKIPVLVEGQRLIISGGVVIPQQQPVAVAQAPRVQQPVQQARPVVQSVGAYIWPVQNGIGTITQYFTSARYGYGHTGVDIADFSGPVLVAIGPGTIISTGWENGGGGCVVRLKLDDIGPYKNMSALYAHTRCNYMVRPGQRVAQNQPLVNMGNTGRSTGTHLHFEMFQNGYFVNAFNYVRR